MSAEQKNRPSPLTLKDVYGFTEREDRDYQVSQERFDQVLTDPDTIVHEVQESYNNYGEWLFVTVSRPAGIRRISVSFYGKGFHEYRERWYTDRWFWYRANNFPERLEQEVDKQDVKRLIEERQTAIAPYVTDHQPSAQAQLFTLLADMMDEDGAYTELEDLEGLAGWLFDESG